MTEVRFAKRQPTAPAAWSWRVRLAVACALAVILAVGTFLYRYLTFTGFSNDHFVHLSLAQQITRGALPVRDFVERGLPLMSVLSAIAQVLVGPGLHAELVLIAAVFAVAAVLAFVVASRVSGSLLVGVGAALVTVFAYPATYGYPKLLAYALVFAAAARYCQVGGTKMAPARALTPVATAPPDAMTLLAAAVVIAFLFRHDHGALLASGVVVLLIAYHGAAHGTVYAVGRFVILTLVLMLPYLAWVQVHEGIDVYLRDGVAFSQRESQRSVWWAFPGFAIDRSHPLFVKWGEGPVINVRWAPELTDAGVAEGETRHGLRRKDPIGPRSWQYELSRWSPSAVERLVRDPAVADTHNIDRETFGLNVPVPTGLYALLVGLYGPGEGLRLRPNGVAAMFYLVWLLPVAAVVCAMTLWDRQSPSVRALAVMAVAVQLAMNLTMLRDPLDSRVRDLVMPASVLLAFVCGTLWSAGRSWPRRLLTRLAAGAVLALAVAASAAIGPLNEQVSEMNALSGRRGLTKRADEIRRELAPPDDRTGPLSPMHQPVVDYIRGCTPVNARVFAMTFAPELFFYTGRRFAGGQVTLTPGYFVTPRHAALMLDRLSREDVPLVIMDTETQEEMRFHYPKVVAYVESRYVESGRFPVGPGKDFIVLTEIDRPARRKFAETQLPCYDEGL